MLQNLEFHQQESLINRSISRDKRSNPTVNVLKNNSQNQIKNSLTAHRKTHNTFSLPLSDEQEAIYLQQRLFADSTLHAICQTIHFNQHLDHKRLALAFRQLLQKNPFLCVKVVKQEDRYWQGLIKDSAQLDATFCVNNKLSLEEDTHIEKIIHDMRSVVSQLEKAPFIQATLVPLQSGDYQFIVCAHHIIIDELGWRQLYDQLIALYKKPDATLGDFISDDQTSASLFSIEHKQFMTVESQKKYWHNIVNNGDSLIALPWDRSKVSLQEDNAAGTYHFTLSNERSQSLLRTIEENHTTLFAVTLTIFQLLLVKLSSQHNFFIAVPVKKNEFTYDNNIKLSISTLPIPCPDKLVNPNTPVIDLINQNLERVIDSINHQNYGINNILKLMKQKPDTSRSPLCQVMFAFQPYRNKQSIYFENLCIGPLTSINKTETPKELTLFVEETNSGISIVFEYSRALLNLTTIKQWADSYSHLLSQFSDDARLTLDQFSSLTMMQSRVLQKRNSIVLPIQRWTLNDAIENYRSHSFNENTIEFKDQLLTHEELLNQVNYVATLLLQKQCKQGDRVAIYISQSSAFVVSLLAVSKIGAVFVPLNPSHPNARNLFVIKDAQCNFIIAIDDSNPPNCNNTLYLPENLEFDTINIDQLEKLETRSKSHTDESLLYILYTSGSTGSPKGVKVSHRNLVNCLITLQDEINLQITGRWLAHTTTTFDISLIEYLLPLLVGSNLLIAPSNVAENPSAILELIKLNPISVIQATPTYWDLLLKTGMQGCRVKKALVAGEVMSPRLARQLTSHCKFVWNLYGPTEATIYSTTYRVLATTHLDVIPIGKPLANTRVYILDDNHKQVLDGVIGTLWIGGANVALGYCNQKNSMELPFKADLIHPTQDRMYNSGDLASYLPNGNILFHGRKDRQIKIHGIRIEPAEIENKLKNVNDIKDALVSIDINNNKNQLIAFIIYRDNSDLLSDESLRKILGRDLPNWMIPHYFISVESFPMSLAGKTDIGKLFDQYKITNTNREEQKKLLSHNHQTLTKTEILLFSIFKKYLNDEITIDSDFFECGGDSLTATLIFSEWYQVTGKLRPINLIFRSKTVRQLSSAFDSYKKIVACRHSYQKNVLFVTPGFKGINIEFIRLLEKYCNAFDQVYPLTYLRNDKKLTLQSICSNFCDEVLSHKNFSRCAILGFSLGGLFATVTLQELLTLGIDVDRLILLDHANPHRHKEKYKNELFQYHVDNFNLSSINKPLMIFKSSLRTDYSDPNAPLGWDDYFTGHIDVHTIEGNHKNMLAEESIRQVSAIIDRSYR